MSTFISLKLLFVKLIAILAFPLSVLIGFVHHPTLSYTATSTPVLTEPSHTPSAQTIATSTASSTAHAPVKQKVKQPQMIPAQPPLPSVPIQVPPTISADVLNAQARAALVNILCTTRAGGPFQPISGSGTIIDPRGIILTNAHVAQFLLLKNYLSPGNIQCVIRTGSPARAHYTARLLYVPPAWVAANAGQILSDTPMGTGENDFAFLLIDGTTDPSQPLPPSFPYLKVNQDTPTRGEQMLLASYPAGFLSGENIALDLYQTTAYASVGDFYVFDSKDQWIDLFSIPGTIVSQSGSSGGEVTRASDGELAGIIVTESAASTTGARDLRAITISHIDHALAARGIGGISDLLSGDLFGKAALFSQVSAPAEEQQLTDALTSKKQSGQ